jgi:hypothetical protein
MVIAKYTDNLYASEVYRELERQAVRKGQFKPSDTELVRLAAQQINQEQPEPTISAEASDDLVQDVARLAFAMRRKGFEAQADDIEQKLLLYKQAESALYNVTPESNMDFVHFSHRDGDVEIIEGSGELGTVETIDSLAKKIRDIAEKEPSGKAPGKSASLEELAALIKEAATEFANVYKKINEKIDAFPPINGIELTFSGKNFVTNAAARDLYAKLAKKDPALVLRAAEMYRWMLGQGFQDLIHSEFLAFIQKNLQNANPVRELADKLGKVEIQSLNGVSGYTFGDQEVYTLSDLKTKYPERDNSKLAPFNPSSIFIQQIRLSGTADEGTNNPVGWGFNQQKASDYAEKLRQAYYTNFSDPAYGAYFRDLNDANEKLKPLTKQMYSRIKGARIRDPGEVRDRFGTIDTDKALKPIFDSQKAINTALNSNEGKWTIAGLDALGYKEQADIIRKWGEEVLGTIFPEAQSKISGQEVEMVDVSPVYVKMDQAIRFWNETGGMSTNATVKNGAGRNIDEVNRLRKAITDVGMAGSARKPRKQLEEALAKNDYGSFQELLADLDKVIARAKADRDKAVYQREEGRVKRQVQEEGGTWRG